MGVFNTVRMTLDSATLPQASSEASPVPRGWDSWEGQGGNWQGLNPSKIEGLWAFGSPQNLESCYP